LLSYKLFLFLRKISYSIAKKKVQYNTLTFFNIVNLFSRPLLTLYTIDC